MALQDNGEIIGSNPALSTIETAVPVDNLTVQFLPHKPLSRAL